MASVLPVDERMVTVLRKLFDGVVDACGENVQLYRMDEQFDSDALGDQKTTTFKMPVTVPAIIDLVPEKRVLKELGLQFDSDEKLPILAKFRYNDEVRQGDLVRLGRKVAVDDETSDMGSYFLEIIDRLVGSRTIEALTVYRLAPTRNPVV